MKKAVSKTSEAPSQLIEGEKVNVKALTALIRAAVKLNRSK